MARFVFEDATPAAAAPAARFVFEDEPDAHQRPEMVASHKPGEDVRSITAGDLVAGPVEGALSLGTGMLAYPAGLAVGAASFALGRGKDPLDVEAAKDWRTKTQEALTYSPRTDSGQGFVGAVGRVLEPWTKSAEYVGQKVEDVTGSPMAGGAASEVFGAVVNPLTPILGARGLAREPIAAPTASSPGLLRRAAESAAVRAANADRTAFRQAFGKPVNEMKLHRTGAFLLDESVPLRSPTAMRDALQAIKDTEGPAIGQLAAKAEQAGATVNLRAAVDRALKSPSVVALTKNTETRPLHARVVAFLEDQIKQHGDVVSPVVAHDIRRQLGPLGQFDKMDLTRPKPLADAFKGAYGSVNGELAKAMRGAGLGDDWMKVNANFTSASTAKKLADVGHERNQGNRFLRPSEKFTAGLGMAGSLMNPAALALPVAQVALNRGFFPATARSLNALSRLAAPDAYRIIGSPDPAALALAEALSSAPASALGTPRLRLGLSAAHEQEDR